MQLLKSIQFAIKLALRKRAQQVENSCEEEKQPAWLALALAILPGVLAIIVEKLCDIIIHYFFGQEEEEQAKENEEPEKEEKEEEAPKRKFSKGRPKKDTSGSETK